MHGIGPRPWPELAGGSHAQVGNVASGRDHADARIDQRVLHAEPPDPCFFFGDDFEFLNPQPLPPG